MANSCCAPSWTASFKDGSGANQSAWSPKNSGTSSPNPDNRVHFPTLFLKEDWQTLVSNTFFTVLSCRWVKKGKKMLPKGKCLRQDVKTWKTVGIYHLPGMCPTEELGCRFFLDPEGRRIEASPWLLMWSGFGAACSKFKYRLLKATSWPDSSCIARWS